MLHVCNASFFVNLFYDRQVTPPIVIIIYNYIRINKVVCIYKIFITTTIVFPGVFLSQPLQLSGTR